MLRKTLLSVVATVMAFTAVGVSPAAPAEAFGEAPFIQVWNANRGVVDRAMHRFEGNPSVRQSIRLLREIARAENRVIVWLRERPATACQRPWKTQMMSRGIVARKSFKAAARAASNGNFNRATTLLERGFRFDHGMYTAGLKMIQICPPHWN